MEIEQGEKRRRSKMRKEKRGRQASGGGGKAEPIMKIFYQRKE
jgi:hypothetical protein